MAADSNERDAVAQDGEIQTDRRSFMKSAAAASLLGPAGAVTALGESTQAPARQAAQQSQTAETNLPPPGLSPRAFWRKRPSPLPHIGKCHN